MLIKFVMIVFGLLTSFLSYGCDTSSPATQHTLVGAPSLEILPFAQTFRLTWQSEGTQDLVYIFRGHSLDLKGDINLERIDQSSSDQWIDPEIPDQGWLVYQIVPQIGALLGPPSNPVTVAISQIAPPTIAWVTRPEAFTSISSQNATFQVIQNDLEWLFECQFDAGTFEPCETTLQTNFRQEGKHTIRIRGRKDLATTDVLLETSWVLDTVHPTIEVSLAPEGTIPSTEVNINWQCNEDCFFSCELDNQEIPACAPPLTLSNLLEGSHQLVIWGEDLAGNRSEISEIHWQSIVTESPQHDFVEIALGEDFGCALDSQHFIWCFGSNQLGIFGDVTPQDTTQWIRLSPDNHWQQIDAGRYHFCALNSADEVWCIGDNRYGQTGADPSQPNTASFHQLDPDIGWTAIGLGQWHTCGIDDLGELYCWGLAEQSRLANASLIPTHAPQLSQTTAFFEDLSIGHTHGCALDDTGAPWCWGPILGSLDFGFSGSTLTMPTQVTTQTFQQISGGGQHSCVTTNDKAIWCWGDNLSGQLGLGDLDNRTEPSLISGVLAEQMSLGGRHTCAIETDNSLWCWGDNSAGQLLQSPDSVSSPTISNNTQNWSAIDAFESANCGIASGNVYCWGTAPFLPPIDRSAPPELVAISK